jgi:hypothetical protein
VTTNISSPIAVSDSSYGSRRRQPDDRAPSQASVDPASLPPVLGGPDDLMLVIEEDEILGGFIYKTVNRRTGAVVRVLSRAELLKLREAAGYVAGAVLSTHA